MRAFTNSGSIIMDRYVAADTMHIELPRKDSNAIWRPVINVDTTTNGDVTIRAFSDDIKLLLALNHATASTAIRNDQAIAAPKIPKYSMENQRKNRNGSNCTK